MKTFLAFAIGLFVLLLLGGERAMAETKCARPEQVGCVQIDFIVVKHNSGNQNLKTLVNSKVNSPAQAVDLAMPIYKEVEAGKLNLYTDCVEYQLFFWNVDTSVSLNQMAFYADGSPFSPSLEVALGSIPPEAKDIYPSLGNPVASYRVKVCGGKSSFQVPWEYIGDNTYALICAIGTGSLYPDSDRKEQGIWLSSESWNFFKANNYQWILIPLVMP